MKVILPACLILAVFSCKNKVEAPPAFEGNIVITYPTEKDTVKGGTMFTVTGTITGNITMHGYEIQVYNQLNQDVIYDQNHHEHGTSFALSEQITHTLTDTVPLRLVVEAAGNHEGEVVNKEVLFVFIP